MGVRVPPSAPFLLVDPINPYLLHITLDNTASPEALLKVKVEHADYQQEVEKKVKEYSQKVKLRGFRPGKVPLMHIKQVYGASITAQEVNRLAVEALEKYIKEKKWNLLGEPILDAKSLDALDWKHATTFDLSYRVGLVSDFAVQNLSAIQLTKYDVQPDAQDIAETIESIRYRFGTRSQPEAAGHPDDVLYGTFTHTHAHAKQEKKAFLHFHKLSGDAKKAFRDKKIGDAWDIQLDTLYAEEKDRALLKKYLEKDAFELKNPLLFTLTRIERSEQAALDTALFDKMFGEGQIKDAATFQKAVGEYLRENYAQRAHAYSQQQIKELLQKHVPIPLPETYLQEQFKAHVAGKIAEEAFGEAYAQYVAEVPWRLLKQRIVKEQKISITLDRLQKEAQDRIYAQFSPKGELQGAIKAQADALVAAFMEDKAKLEQLYHRLEEEQVFAWLDSQVSCTTKTVSIANFHKLIQAQV